MRRRAATACRSAERPIGRTASAKSAGMPRAAQGLRRQIDPAKNFARRQHVGFAPVTKSTIGICRSPPSRDQIVPTPSSAAVSEIIGPAGSDMQMLPPTVAVFQILKEAANARQHWPISGEAVHSTGSDADSSAATVQVAAIRSPRSSDLDRRPAGSQGRSAGSDAAAARRTARCRRRARHRRPASAATGRRRAAGPPL